METDINLGGFKNSTPNTAWWVPVALFVFAMISFAVIWYMKRGDRMREEKGRLDLIRKRAASLAGQMAKDFNLSRNKAARDQGEGLIWSDKVNQPPFYYRE
jgi:membrane protein implicated in regulation of membrane protease activity